MVDFYGKCRLGKYTVHGWYGYYPFLRVTILVNGIARTGAKCRWTYLAWIEWNKIHLDVPNFTQNALPKLQTVYHFDPSGCFIMGAHLKDIATRELPHKFRRHGVQHTVGHLKKKRRRWKYWRWISRSLRSRCGMPQMFHVSNIYLLYMNILDNDSLTHFQKIISNQKPRLSVVISY